MPDLPIDKFPNLFVNKKVPVITPEGASPAAYDDPNSPESILRRLTQTQVQSEVDRKFDVPVSPYEGFYAPRFRYRGSSSSPPFNSALLGVLAILAGLSLRAAFRRK